MENSPKKLNVRIVILIVVAVILLLIIGWSARSMFQLYNHIQTQAAATPTPSPNISSMLSTTLDPLAPTPTPAPLLLKSGSAGEKVSHLQTRLRELGYYQGEVDGQFGPGTKDAVVWFQTQHGLNGDGIVGPATMDMMDSTTAQMAIATPGPKGDTLPLADINDENGLPLLVNRQSPIPADFQALDLVYLNQVLPQELVVIKGGDIQGNATAATALQTMFTAAHHQGLTIWQISAGYRSYTYQQSLFDDKVASYKSEGFSNDRAISAAKQTVAEPGTSEHHTGLAFDITVPGETFKYTDQSKWLAANCWDYGFIIRYQEDKQDITGFLAEPWHIRYVGVEHSLPMKNGNLALEEYLADQVNNISFVQ